MRAKIRAIKEENGWVMVGIVKGQDDYEYPQEGQTHENRKSVYEDARHMYDNATWDWRESDKTIKIDPHRQWVIWWSQVWAAMGHKSGKKMSVSNWVNQKSQV